MRLALLLLAPAVAHACSCIGPVPVCEAFTQSPVIFLGTVVNVSVDNMTVQVDLVVNETFRGEPQQQRTIYTHEQSSACGFPFQKGLQYVVYANEDRASGKLSTNKCSSTHQIEPGKQDADLKWMREYPTASPTATIFGGIFMGGDLDHPKIEIKIRGPENRNLTTDAEGTFSVAGLPPGTYTVSGTAPPGLVTAKPRTVTIAAKGCAEFPWGLSYDSHLSGKLTMPDGSPAPGMDISLLRPDSRYPGGLVARDTRTSDADGRYAFSNVDPGDYFIAANTLGPAPTRPYPKLFMPGVDRIDQATRVHLAPSQNLTDLDIAIPAKLKAIVLEVKFLLPNGSPAVDARVMARDTNHVFSPEVPSGATDSEGAVKLTVFADRDYYLTAWAFHGVQLCGGPIKFTAKPGSTLEPIKLTPSSIACPGPPR